MTATIAPSQREQGGGGSVCAPGEGAERSAFGFSERYILGVLLTFATLLFTVAARLRMQALPGGDEPHYLAISVALLKYHTVDPTPVYAHPADYHAFYSRTLDVPVSRLADGTAVPLHNAGGPLLWAPAYALGGRLGVELFLVLVSVLIVFNLYRLLRSLGVVPSYATIVTGLFALGSPVFMYAPLMFIESLGALFVLYAVRQVLTPTRRPVPLLLASAALGYLPFVHGRFVIFTAILGALLTVRIYREGGASWRTYAYALGPLVVIGGAVTVFNVVRYGTVNPAPGNASMGGGLFQIPVGHGLFSLFFDRYFGLLPYFPLFLLVLPGLALSLRRGLAWTHVTLLAVTVPYTLAIATFSAWFGGFSPPGRLLVAVTPPLAFYVAVVLQRLHSWIVTVFAMLAALLSFMVSLAGDIQPYELFNDGVHDKPLDIDEIGHLFGASQLSRMLPSLFTPAGDTWRTFWLCAGAAFLVGLVLWLVGRRTSADRVPVAGSGPALAKAGGATPPV